MPAYYPYHVFFCTNCRADGRQCCADYAAVACRDYAKARLKDLARHGKGLVRINQAGCLDRCAEGPVMVVYPQEIWYSYVDKDDIDEIIEQHLLRDKPVARLQI